ncbi:MAG: hypothetical protein AB8B63_10945 [Granulosicoccus sp.]
MSYKTIAVCLTCEVEARRIISIAAMLARKFDAHVNGLYCLQNMEVYAGISMQLSGATIAEM